MNNSERTSVKEMTLFERDVAENVATESKTAADTTTIHEDDTKSMVTSPQRFAQTDLFQSMANELNLQHHKRSYVRYEMD